MIETHTVLGPIKNTTICFASELWPKVAYDFQCLIVTVDSYDTVAGTCVATVTADATVFPLIDADPNYTVDPA